MDEKSFQELRERLQKANGLRSRISKCKQEVASYTHLSDSAIHGSNREEFLKKKLTYFLNQLDAARKKYEDF